MPNDGTLRLNFEPELLARLDDLMKPVSESVAVQELGTRVSRHLGARIALLRGLTSMEAQYLAGSDIVSHEKPTPTAKPPPSSEASSPTPQRQEEPSKPPEQVTYTSEGLVKVPDGWSLWQGNAVPAEHKEIHDHYTSRGLTRYTGVSGKEVIHFYWSQDPAMQEVDPFEVPDAKGKKVLVQETPYGPGHIIPHKYSGPAA